MHDDILYSVLIPAYNAETYLEECLDSVLAQTHRNLQVVVIDDGSTDRTAEILDRYAAKDSRLEVVHRENRGVATTRLELFKMAKGKYLNFVDADDTVEPEMAQVMIDVMEECGADVSVCGITLQMENCFDSNSLDKVSIEIISGNQARKEFLEHKRLIGSLCTKVCRRDICCGITCPPEVRYGEDAVMSWQILKRVSLLVFVDVPFYHYRMNETSISHELIGVSRATGIYAWKIICNSIVENQDLSDIARAQQANQAASLMRDIALQGTKCPDLLTTAKDLVIKNLWPFLRNRKTVTSMHLFVWSLIALANFRIARLLAKKFSRHNQNYDDL